MRPYDVDRQHLIAFVALQLDAVRAQLVMPWNEHRPFDDAIACVIEVFLNDGEPLAQDVAIHAVRCRTALRAPQLAHAFLIVRFHGGEKLGHRFIHRLRHRPRRTRILAASGAAGEHQKHHREPSLHKARPVVGVTRR